MRGWNREGYGGVSWRLRRTGLRGRAGGSPASSGVAWQQRLVMQNCQGIEPKPTWIREGYLDTVRAEALKADDHPTRP